MIGLGSPYIIKVRKSEKPSSSAAEQPIEEANMRSLIDEVSIWKKVFVIVLPPLFLGNEILGPEDKSLKFEFGSIFMEFKTDKMKINGKVEY